MFTDSKRLVYIAGKERRTRKSRFIQSIYSTRQAYEILEVKIVGLARGYVYSDLPNRKEEVKVVP